MRRTAHGVCLLLASLRRTAHECACYGLGLGCWRHALAGWACEYGADSAGLDVKPIPVKEPARREKVSYSREIAELLENKCTGCHGSVLAEKGLSLESVAGMLKGGKRGPAIVRGKADSSLMFKMAAHRVSPVMPPKDKPANKPMTSLELGLLQMWINEGAKDDSDEDEPRNEAPRSIVLGDLPPGVQPINAVDMTLGRCSRRGRPRQSRAGLRRRFRAGDRLAGRAQGPDPVRAVQPRRHVAGRRQLPDRHGLDGPEGNLLKTLAGHVGPVLSLAVAPDGVTAYSGGQDKTIRVWNLAEGKLLRSFDRAGAGDGGGDRSRRAIALDRRERRNRSLAGCR